MNTRPISFPNWKDSLARAALSPQQKAAYAREIVTFLHHCKVSHAAATVELIKQWLIFREKQSSGPAREAMRWFFQEGRKAVADATAGAEWPVLRSLGDGGSPRPAGDDPESVLGTSRSTHAADAAGSGANSGRLR